MSINRGCLVSVLRLLTVVQSTQSKDSTFDKVPSALYGVIEPNLGIFCACVVTLKPLFRRYATQTGMRLDLSSHPRLTNEVAQPVFQRYLFLAYRRTIGRSGVPLPSESSRASGQAGMGGT